MSNEATAQRLIQLALDFNWNAWELAARLGIEGDRLNNGGLLEVITLALENDDPEWIEERINA